MGSQPGRERAPGRPTEPQISSTIRRTVAATTLSLLATLTLAVGVAVNPGAAQAASSSGGSSKPVGAVAVHGSSKGATVARWAQNQVGKSYRFGATGPSSFDCSGISQRGWANVGVKLPRTAAQQSRVGQRITRSQLRPGDLIFWSNRGGVSHVAISLGGNAIVHAANSRKGVLRGTIYGSPVAYRRVG